MSLTTPQKNKWRRLKAEIIKRPFIAYSIGLTSKDIDELFFDGFPSLDRLERLQQADILLREEKTDRLRPTLIRVVGSRGSVQFANKIGTDGMSIKYIIDKRYKRTPSHDLIAKIEILLNYICEFEVSLEYQSESKVFLINKIDKLALESERVASSLRMLPEYLQKLKPFDKNKNATYYYRDSYVKTSLIYCLDKAISDLEGIRLDVEVVIESYIES